MIGWLRSLEALVTEGDFWMPLREPMLSLALKTGWRGGFSVVATHINPHLNGFHILEVTTHLTAIEPAFRTPLSFRLSSHKAWITEREEFKTEEEERRDFSPCDIS